MNDRMDHQLHPNDPPGSGGLTPIVTLGEDGILRVDYSEDDRISLAAVRRSLARHVALCPDRKTPVLLFGTRVGSVEYQAQRYASSPEVCAVTAAMAIIVKSFLERHLARMFLVYHRPPYPVQVFGDPAPALAWLRRFLPPA
jgi:hypothetical protein